MKNFFRKVAFGIGPNEEVPSDPLAWALNQLDDVPDLTWKGKIPSGKEMIEIHGKEKFLEIAESMGRYVTYTFNKDKNWAELVTLAFERHYSGFRDENTDFIVKRFIEKYKGQK